MELDIDMRAYAGRRIFRQAIDLSLSVCVVSQDLDGSNEGNGKPKNVMGLRSTNTNNSSVIAVRRYL